MSPKSGILSYLLFVVLVLLVRDLKVLMVFSAVAVFLIIFLPQRRLRSGAVPITLFLSMTFLFNALFMPGRILFEIGPLTVTQEGVHTATLRTLRVFLLIAGAKLLTLVAGLDEMITAMGRLFSPLEKLGVPIQEFFGIMSLAIRALPVIRKRIAEEYGRQLANAVQKTIMQRIRIVFRFLLPLLVEGIRDPRMIFDELNESEQKRMKNMTSEDTDMREGDTNG